MSENLEIEKQPDTHRAVIMKMVTAMFWGALWWTLGTIALGVLLAGVLVGWHGVFGALVGGAIGVLSSLATLLLMRQTAGMNPNMLIAAVLGAFVLKMVILLLAMTLLGDIEVLHRNSLAFTLLATIIVTATTEALAFQRTKVPTIIPKSAED
ncbi:hypothetical protein [Actinocrispum wychmicini]|uniref:ATP synthase protein I n=1 Tax=Actinocrispum wychmicini TaxID=1213861 RepID=A0A4V2S6U1_9PSEU|nr:hypothetical protein [Actinocrispum wychmicini]TCO57370.1 hypothetical protein EV192_106847 [Actinocrispum wychmicini]